MFTVKSTAQERISMNNSMQSKKNMTKLIVRIVVIALIGGFLGCQIYLINAERLVGDAMPMPFGVGASVVLSGSMEPSLSVDDLIIVVKQDEYNIGDVVVYQQQGILIVHEIIEKNGNEVVTKGSANDTADDPISTDSIKGKVTCSIPMIGGVVGFFKTPIGIVLVIGAAILLMELSFKKDKKKDLDDIEAIKDEIRKLKGE